MFDDFLGPSLLLFIDRSKFVLQDFIKLSFSIKSVYNNQIRTACLRMACLRNEKLLNDGLHYGIFLFNESR